MRTVLRLIGTRYGIALALCLMVLLVVGAFRGIAGSNGSDPVAPVIARSTEASVDPSAGDDGLGEDDAGTGTAPPPSVISGAAAPDAIAMSFATAWLRHSGVTTESWLAGMTPYSTPALLNKLHGVDPAGVPADRVTGTAQLNARDPALVEASIPVDSGTLRLRLLVDKGRWRVDGVDWERPT
jgi:hypothetical protein